MVLQGDPSPDMPPYENYLISYAYIGALTGYEGADEDTDYNFALTTSSDTFLEDGAFPKEFGNRNGTGVTDIIMVGTEQEPLIRPIIHHSTQPIQQWIRIL